jgi:pimeloyl-ACP methyl ester carboxylesterase
VFSLDFVYCDTYSTISKESPMKRIILRFSVIVISVYLLGCVYMYLNQEQFIFLPTKIPASQRLSYTIPSEECVIPVNGAKLSAIHFKVPNPKGVIFFLHGNAGNLLRQGVHAKFYTSLGYDFFSFDYRTYGKSTGELNGEKQFFDDVRAVYKYVKTRYNEKQITVIGYSLGTGSAAMIASENNPKKLALIAPYYSLSKMTVHRYKILPTFLLKYPFDTYRYLEKTKAPVFLVHGDQDEVLPFEGSLELAKLLKKGDQFVPIKGQMHNFFEDNSLFRQSMSNFLK